MRYRGAAPDIDKDPRCGQRRFAYGDRIWPDKPRMCGEDRAMLRAAQPGFNIAAGFGGDRGGAGLDPCHVNAQRPVKGEAILRAAPYARLGRWRPASWSACSRY